MKNFLMVILVLLVIFGIMVFVDSQRAATLRGPIFAIPIGVTADDGGSGTYQGLGYTVEVGKYITSEGKTQISSVKMIMFGKVIGASIE
ncbi:MAG: hypothetical protein PHY39_07920 [Endomicrobiaceae bacterium]|nr:hypothetical protein [Endomicrobiaceae bacterium]